MAASLIFVLVTSENQGMGASSTLNGEMPLILSSLMHAFTSAVMRCLRPKCFVSLALAALREQGAEGVIYPNGAISTGKLATSVIFGFPFSSQT